MDPTLTQHQINAYAAMVWTRAIAFVPDLIAAALIVIVGSALAAWMARSAGKMLDRSDRVDITARPIIVTALRYSILLVVVIVALAQLGVQTASLLAVLGAAGLAIGLALQGTLTNIAAGVMLLWLRPFRVGDYIEVPSNNISGVVREIGLFISQLETIDGICVVAPNSAIWNATLRNHMRSPGRLVSYSLTFAAGADIGKTRDILLKMLESDPRLGGSARPLIFVESFTPGGVVLNCTFRARWVNLGEIQRTMIEDARRHFEGTGDAALMPQQMTRTIPADADPSRFVTLSSATSSK